MEESERIVPVILNSSNRYREWLAALPTGKRPLYLNNRGWVGPRAVLQAGPLPRTEMNIRLLLMSQCVWIYVITLSRLSREHVGHLSD
jgi:hypothetical protein